MFLAHLTFETRGYKAGELGRGRRVVPALFSPVLFLRSFSELPSLYSQLSPSDHFS